MNIVKKVWNYVLWFFEVIMPAVSLIGIFLIFNVQIFYRYVLESPLIWAFEASLTLFLWLIMFGAVYAWRKKEHVQFSIFYDLAPSKVQLFIRLISNSVVIIFLSIVVYPVSQQLNFLNRISSPQLDIPLSIVFLPMLICFILIIFHSFVDILHDLRKLKSGDGDYTETIYEDQYVELEPQDEETITIFNEQGASTK